MQFPIHTTPSLNGAKVLHYADLQIRILNINYECGYTKDQDQKFQRLQLLSYFRSDCSWPIQHTAITHQSVVVPVVP